MGVFRIPNPNDPSDPSNSSSAGGSSASSSSGTSDDVKAEGNVYVLKNSALEDQNVEYRYYYEVILSKKFPVYFARFVHPDDVLVRAGAVCVIDIKEEDFNPSYAYALANWQSYSQSYLQRYISSSKRLNADREALENIARYFLNQDKSLLTNI